MCLQCISFARILCFTDADLDEYHRQVDAELERISIIHTSDGVEINGEPAEPAGLNPYSAHRRDVCKTKRNDVFSLPTELLTLQRVRLCLESAAGTFETSLDEDVSQLHTLKQEMHSDTNDGGDDDRGRKMSALHFRITRKEIIVATLGKLNILENYIKSVIEANPVGDQFPVVQYIIVLQESLNLESRMCEDIGEVSRIPKQPGIYCNMSDYVDEDSRVIRVGTYNDLTMQNRRVRKAAQEQYLRSLVLAAHAYRDNMRSTEGCS
jgi:hypothetical protein